MKRWLAPLGIALSLLFGTGTAAPRLSPYAPMRYGHEPIRLLFFWASGLFGYTHGPIPIGGHYQTAFFQEVDKALTHLPNLFIELIIDRLTLTSNQTYLDPLLQKFGSRFRITLIEDHIAEYEAILSRLHPETSGPEIKRLRTLLKALYNANQGNPALASDIARIWLLHDPRYRVNVYVDVDTFVENTHRGVFAVLFPRRPQPDNLIRLDKDDGLVSNDLLASYGIKPEKFEAIRNRLLDDYLSDPARQAVLEAYTQKWHALKAPTINQQFALYQQATQNILQILWEDVTHNPHPKFTLLNMGKMRGLSLPVALLRTTGTSSDMGAPSFIQELYPGLKPSSQSWGTFAWTPTDILKKDQRLAWLVAYLLDWRLLRMSKENGFLYRLAAEIIRLDQSIIIPPRRGIEIFNEDTKDILTQDAYRKLKVILGEVKDFLNNPAGASYARSPVSTPRK